MAQTKWSHDLSVVVEPPANRSQRISNSFLFADLLTANGHLGAASSGILLRSGSLLSVGSWMRIGPDLTLQNVDYLRRNGDGTVSNRYTPHLPSEADDGGYHVQSRYVPKDLHVDGDGAGNMTFTPISGSFRTVPANGDYGKGIYVTGDASGVSAVRSTQMLGRNGDFRGRIQLLGSKTQLGAGDIPYAYIPFGNIRQWRVALRHGMYPTIERNRGGTWEVVRRVDEAGLVQTNSSGGSEWKINIRNIGESLIYDLNGHMGWCKDTSEDGRQIPAFWDEAPVGLETNACRVRLDYGEEVLREEDGSLITGVVSRKAYYGSGRNGDGKPTQLVELIKPVATGYQSGGTAQKVEAEEEVDGIRYTNTLTPDNKGIVSPVVSSVFLGYAPVWTTPSTGNSINISNIVSSASVELADNPVQRNNTGSLEVPYSLVKAVGNVAMEAAIQDFSNIVIKTRWRDASGNPVSGEAGQWAPVFDGVILGVNQGVPTYNGRVISVKMQDKLALMTDNRGVVDGGAYPLDVLIHRKNQQLRDTIFMAGFDGNDGFYKTDEVDFSTDPPTRYISVYDENNELVAQRPVSAQDYAVLDVYGAECVQEILRMALGPDEVANLNGGASGSNNPPMRFFPPNHLPMVPLSRLKGGILPISQGFGENTSNTQLGGGNFVFAPNYLETYLAWVEKFENDEAALFKYGHTDRTLGGRFVPIYCQRDKYLRTCGRVWSVDESVLASLDFESRPEKNFNSVLVVANEPGKDAAGLGVGMIYGEARLPPSHPNSQENTGRRVLVVKSNYGLVPGGAASIAYSILAELPDGIPQWPTQTLAAGEGWIFPGDVVFGSNMQHSAPQLQNVMFNAARISHKWAQNGQQVRDHVTTVTLGPLSAKQVLAALANENGEHTLRI